MENSHDLFRVLSTICECDQDINSDCFLSISNLEIIVISSSREPNMSDCRTGRKLIKLPQKISGKQNPIVFLTSSGENLSQIGMYCEMKQGGFIMYTSCSVSSSFLQAQFYPAINCHHLPSRESESLFRITVFQ